MGDLIAAVGASHSPRTSFRHRMTAAREHERSVIQRLAELGWRVQEWGQGILTDPVRSELARTESLVRWQPDALAVLAPRVVWIDAKGDLSATGNHSIENMAQVSHLRRMAAEGVPVVYVWPDWSSQVASRVVVEAVFRGARRYATRGSGTPFLLTRKSACVPFDGLLAQITAEWPDWTAEALDALGRMEVRA